MFEQKLNFEIKAGKKRLACFESIATKVGGLFGGEGREIGEKVDEITENITIEQDILSYNNDKS